MHTAAFMNDSFLSRVQNTMIELVQIMMQLRTDGGCPWDREQTLESLKIYLIEETYEVLDALENDDCAGHLEELGDLLLQVIFQAEIRREAGEFDIADVAEKITHKLRRRHPHVFGETKVSTAKEALGQWEALKRAEGKTGGTLAGVPRALPGLIRGLRMGEKAAHAGFDFTSSDQAISKIDEELAELKAATSLKQKEEEIGDLLFSVINAARKFGIDPEESLRQTLDRFSKRFSHMEASSGGQLQQLTDEAKEAFWQAAKIALTTTDESIHKNSE